MATKRRLPNKPGPDENSSLEALFAADDLHEEDTGDLAHAAEQAIAGRTSSGPSIPVVTGVGRLEYVAPDGTAHTRPLGERTSIGRHTDNDIQLLDPEVSKAHLTIKRVPDGWLLEDLGSANGTLVNGVRVDKVKLADNDVVAVGNSVLRFRVEVKQPPAAAKAPPQRPDTRVNRFTSSSRLQSFSEVSGIISSPTNRWAPSSSDDAERTVVTLVPTQSEAEGAEESVFAAPVEEDFPSEDQIREERLLRRDYERLRVAFDLSLTIGLETDLQALGDTILGRILDILPADTAVIMLHQDEELTTLASFADRRAEVRIPRAIIERVLKSRAGLLTTDALRDQQLRRSETVVMAQIRSALCVPLVAGDEVVGIIHVSSSSAAGAYEEKDLALLRAIAQPAALAVANARLIQKVETEAAARAELNRFLSPALVEKVVRNELGVAKAGDKVPATVLFSDIRGFTTLSDGLPPEEVVSLLNEYFEAMVEVVFELGGTLDKFIGDGLMAVWGTPVQTPDDAVLAVKAAARMRDVLEATVNASRVKRGEAPLRAGYGIASGTVVAGAMGARRRQDFTVIGDVVNLSSRLCGEAKPKQILVDENTERACKRAGISLEALEARQVKGVRQPVPVWQVPLAWSPPSTERAHG